MLCFFNQRSLTKKFDNFSFAKNDLFTIIAASFFYFWTKGY